MHAAHFTTAILVQDLPLPRPGLELSVAEAIVHTTPLTQLGGTKPGQSAALVLEVAQTTQTW